MFTATDAKIAKVGQQSDRESAKGRKRGSRTWVSRKPGNQEVRSWFPGFRLNSLRSPRFRAFAINRFGLQPFALFAPFAVNPPVCGSAFVFFVCFVVTHSAMPLSKADLQRLRSLRDKKHREELGLFVVEGAKVVTELLAAGFPFEAIYVTPEAASVGDAAPSPRHLPNAAGAPRLQLIEITADEMARSSHFPTPSTVLAVGKLTRTPLAPGALERGLTLALDGVQDAGNVGTLLRIADWFGLDRVVLSPDCADLFHQKVINASMGSFARVRAHTADLAAALAGVKVPVLGCDLQGDDVHALPALRDAVIVIGSEGSGLSAAVKPHVTRYVTIRRYGGAESLNAGVAAAIVCDNLRRAVKT
jgi:TrmH family RNA methyltransferase